MPEVSKLKRLHLTCPSCGIKQDAGMSADDELYSDRVSRGKREDHRCRRCGTLASYLWEELTFDGGESLTWEELISGRGQDG